jgi:chromosomal replication initiation ATPase DnaA
MAQMTFQFDPTPNYSGANFIVADSNRAPFDAVHSWPNWPAPAVILVGPKGVGKTHLLELWSLHAASAQCRVSDLREDFNPTRYALRPVALDDADQVTGQIGRERALLHLYNLAMQNKQTFLMTASSYPQQWGLLLPDLASRLRAAVVIEIAQPDEELMRQLYLKLFADRQLQVSAPVIDWLLARMERSAVTAQQIVAAIDQTALQLQKPITVWLARRALGFGEEEE